MYTFDAIVTSKHLFGAVEFGHVGISFPGKGSRDWDDCGRWIYDVHAQKKGGYGILHAASRWVSLRSTHHTLAYED
jgi:hypothetical protein